MTGLTGQRCASTEWCVAEEALRRFTRGYTQLMSLIASRHRMHPETVLRWVEETAKYAVGHHPGRFADGALETMALEIGMRLDRRPVGVASKRGELGRTLAPLGTARRVLHVASRVEEIGGHTRTIRHWIRSDPESRHSVVLIRQGAVGIPSWLIEDVRRAGGRFVNLPLDSGLLPRAKALRAIARTEADVIVVHHWGQDVVPLVAFACADLPPVAILNHADHMFWLGSSVTDVVVNQREAGARLSAMRRFTRYNTVLPIPLPSREKLDRADARRRLGISADQRMLLSVGRAVKYKPTKGRDFLRTMRKVLDGLPGAHLHVVGMGEKDASELPNYSSHPRIHLCGPVANPSAYQAAADLYIESFPFGSATALLEVGHAGVPAVLPFNPQFDLLVTNHGLEGLLSHAASEEEYIEQVRALAENAAEREQLGLRLKAHIRLHHTGEGWARQLAATYAVIEGLTHTPRAIPASDAQQRPEDLVLSEWHAFLNGYVDASWAVNQRVTQAVANTVYYARGKNDNLGAFALLWRYLVACVQHRDMLLTAAKVLARWILRRLRLHD